MPSHLARAFCVLLPLSLLSLVYLYNYPAFDGCAFPAQVAPDNSSWATFKRAVGFSAPPGHLDAPFRLLALGDPQLEGDSSLFNPLNGYFPSVSTLWSDVTDATSLKDRLDISIIHFWSLLSSDIPWIFYNLRKTIDLWGNDHYLAHIYRTLHRILKPTHVTVLGDLIGSQWINDEEFDRRGRRYWDIVFKGGRRVEEEVAAGLHLGPLGQDKSWETRIINVAGNHDIGYAGDITYERMARFERVFGKANWETRFTLPLDNTTVDGYYHVDSLPELRIIILNSLNLDTPALELQLQSDTYQFINNMITVSRPVEDKSTATILLTHVPLHKEDGVCVDSPYFSFHNEEHGGGVKEQNHLSYDASKGILEGIYGMSGNPDAPAHGFGRHGIILTGHDHEGCDVYHHLPDDEDKAARRWKAERWAISGAKGNNIPGIREVTVRSMMGGYGGNAGLLSAWYDHNTERWRLEFATCPLGTQHIWWAVHILDLITIVLALAVAANHYRGKAPKLPSKKSKPDIFKPRKRANTTLDKWLETAKEPEPLSRRKRANTLDKWLEKANEPAALQPRKRATTLHIKTEGVQGIFGSRSSPLRAASSSLENASARAFKRRPP